MAEEGDQVLGFVLTCTGEQFWEEHAGTRFLLKTGAIASQSDLESLKHPNLIYIWQLGVQAGFNKQGVGSALLQRVHEHFGAGYGFFAAVVFRPEENAASRSFFERHAYNPVGSFRTENHKSWPLVESWVMYLPPIMW